MKIQIRIIVCVLLLCVNVNEVGAQKYFQQEVNYTINVTLNDSTHELFAFEEIEYINNSPDNLEFIYMHLWPNAYSNNETAMGQQMLEQGGKRKYFEVESQRAYIDSLDFRVNGIQVKCIPDPEHIDICKILLDEPLKAGEKLVLTTPFHVKIPQSSSSRFGYLHQSYRISQWFPKPAVYDRYGWHQMPNLIMGEFYAEFGTFDVSITLPENYVVGATGNLVSNQEIEWLNNKVEETKNKTEFDRAPNLLSPSSTSLKTIRYSQDNIHDFAWFANKNYNVLNSEVELPNTGKTVSTWAFFLDSDYDFWKEATQYINDALYYYSLWYGDYPYDNCTAVRGFFSGGGGIEYPTITLVGQCPTKTNLEHTIAHEVGHNWFYGALGFNERNYPWLDEGFNSFSDDRYMRTKYPDEKLFKYLSDNVKNAKLLGIDQLKYSDFSRKAYLFNARRNIDQAANLPSIDYSKANYYTSVIYKKNAVSFMHLLNYLGENEFNRIMKMFYKEWEFKHPDPTDFINHFKRNTDRDLDWLFNDLITTNKKLDYAVKRIKDEKVLIKNKGKINAPFSVSGVKDGDEVYTKWYNGFTGKKWVPVSTAGVDHVYIDYRRVMPDLYFNNNSIKTEGFFKKLEPIKLSYLGLVEDPSRTQINLTPLVAWNKYNKLLLGTVFYSNVLPVNKLEYQLAPMFSFGTRGLAGTGRVAYSLFPYKGIFQEINMNFSSMQFAYNNEKRSNFKKLKVGIDFTLKSKDLKFYVDNILRISAISATDLDKLLSKGVVASNMMYQFQFEHRDRGSLNQYNYIGNIQADNDYVKASFDGSYRYVYLYDKTLDIRLFGGAFLYKNEQLSNLYNFNLSGINGVLDYSYDHLFFGRFEEPTNTSILANQFVKNEGGFAVYSPFGRSNEWLVSANISTSLPLAKKIPIQLYTNLAFTGEAEPVPGYSNTYNFYYEMGFKYNIDKNGIEVYFPVIMSKNISNYSKNITKNYLERIRFTIDIKDYNLFELFRTQKNL